MRITGVSLSSLYNKARDSFYVKYRKNSKVSGYQIEYSTSKSFSNYKIVTTKGASTLSKTVGNLKRGRTYYVRVRGYKTISGTRYYSTWLAVKSVKISK